MPLSSASATLHPKPNFALVGSFHGFLLGMLTSTVYPSDLASGIIGSGVFPKDKIPLERVGTEEDM